MPPTLATWWLIPRLERFFTAFPDTSLELSATTLRTDFALGHHDVAIRYSRLVPSGLHGTPLSNNFVFPVCSPLLGKGAFPLRGPADLPYHRLIVTKDETLHEEPIANWDGWLEAIKHSGLTGSRHVYLSPRGVMLQAVMQGLGVGLARTLLAAEALAARQLVCPFGPALPLSANYYVVCPESNAKDPDIVAFREWVLAEAKVSAARINIPDA